MLTFYLRSAMSLSKELYHPNGVTKARKVPRSEAGFRPASGYVAAIDFGTTNCSVAYTLQGDKNSYKLPLDGPLTRVPNAILIESGTNAVTAFGYRAQDKFSRLSKDQQEKYIYFERMKMILYRTRVSVHITRSLVLFLILLYSIDVSLTTDICMWLQPWRVS